MRIKLLSNIMILSGVILFSYPLVSYVGEEKARPDSLKVLTEADVQKRVDLEKRKLEQGIKEAEQESNILTEDQLPKKPCQEVFLEGAQPGQGKDWPHATRQ